MIRPEAELEPLIQAEADRITAASGAEKPDWLGPPDRGFVAIDYRRFKPNGFYTKTGELEKYFRAVSWLQSIPFRIDRDGELLTILAMGAALRDGASEKECQEQDGFFGCFKDLIGSGDDWDLVEASRRDIDRDLPEVREYLQKEATRYGKHPEINDLMAFAPEDP